MNSEEAEKEYERIRDLHHRLSDISADKISFDRESFDMVLEIIRHYHDEADKLREVVTTIAINSYVAKQALNPDTDDEGEGPCV